MTSSCTQSCAESTISGRVDCRYALVGTEFTGADDGRCADERAPAGAVRPAAAGVGEGAGRGDRASDLRLRAGVGRMGPLGWLGAQKGHHATGSPVLGQAHRRHPRPACGGVPAPARVRPLPVRGATRPPADQSRGLRVRHLPPAGARGAQPLQRQRPAVRRRHQGGRPDRPHRRRDQRLARPDRREAAQRRRVRAARRPAAARRRAPGREHRGARPAAAPRHAHRRQRQPVRRTARQPEGLCAGRERPADRGKPAVRGDQKGAVHLDRAAVPAERTHRQRLLDARRVAQAHR